MKAIINQEQLKALLECAEALKEIVNSADNDEPYLSGEIITLFGPNLNKLYASGIRLKGEL